MYRNVTRILLIVTAIALAIFIAVNWILRIRQSAEALEENPLRGTSWHLVEITDVSSFEDPERIAGPTLRFQADEDVFEGRSYCNRMDGEYSVTSSGEFTYEFWIHTDLGCINENEFYEIMGDVNSFKIEGNRLYLYTPENALIFETSNTSIPVIPTLRPKEGLIDPSK
jgi:heat shock protein HslJ